MHDPMPELRALAQRHALPTCCELLPHLTLWTSYGATPPTPMIYEPMLYFTLHGIKRMTVGERQMDHRPGTFLLASIDVPVVCAVIDCNPERPYLGLGIRLDPAAVAALLLDVPTAPERLLDPAQDELEPMTISPTTRAMNDALLRLVRLVEAPDDVPLLAPDESSASCSTACCRASTGRCCDRSRVPTAGGRRSIAR